MRSPPPSARVPTPNRWIDLGPPGWALIELVDAREQPRRAYVAFASIGAGAFVEPARRELMAAGKSWASVVPRRATSSLLRKRRLHALLSTG
jgi:hypothetical protein